MFGPSLLINPVYQYKQTKRELYLPKGQGWYDLYTGKWTAGGRRITADAPYERMPVYVKEGSIVPFGPELQYTSEKPADTITLYVYTGKNASFQLYEDQGTTYDYEKGQFTTIPFNYDENTKTLTIGDRKGSYPGMLTKRAFRIVWITPTAAKALDLERKPDQEILYEGKKLSIKM
jgi:alpha-D-xyloside xylohydrolase